MSYERTIYLANFADKSVLVQIATETYQVAAQSCPYIITRNSQSGSLLVRIGFEHDQKELARKTFTLDHGACVIGFCEHEGTLHFCEIESLGSPSTLRLND